LFKPVASVVIEGGDAARVRAGETRKSPVMTTNAVAMAAAIGAIEYERATSRIESSLTSAGTAGRLPLRSVVDLSD